MKAFILFLVYVLFLSLLHIASFMWVSIFYLWNGTWRFTFTYEWLTIANYLTLGFALFFAFFAFIMLANQLNLIRQNTSTIDQKMGEKSRAHRQLQKKLPAPLNADKDFYIRLREIMGSRGCLYTGWIVPLTTFERTAESELNENYI